MKKTSDGYFLGVDIGGTKTAFALAAKSGEVVQILDDKGASHEIYGEAETERVLREGIRRITEKAGIVIGDVGYIYYGAAGADTEDDFRLLKKLFRRITPDTAFDFENDGLIALKSGTVGGIGMVITCGTGNTNFAVNSKGVVKRIGGLTPHTGDVLGAYTIAGYVCSAAVRSEDGRDYPSLLGKTVPEALGVEKVEDITNLSMTPVLVQKVIETFFEAARLGDGKALEITWMLVKEVLNTVREFHRALFVDEDRFKLVLEGSVFKGKYDPFMKMLELALHQKYQAEIVVPNWDPVLGALFFAFESGGIELGRDLSGKIVTSYLKKKPL
ncbi:MAG: hypothetical protein GY866_37075 [Proteobacteria bacterium]|nr:hypothetical protein [Pseudomonadota bacterium]